MTMSTSTMSAEPLIADLPITAVTDEGLGNTSWVVCLDGQGIVVDPERDPAPYEAAAERLGVQLTLAAETHLHADFVTGSRELAANHGALVAASAAGELAWPHQPITDGHELDFGRWRLRALATPGHTPEHLAYVLLEGGRPRAVFTGGSLMVGSVARTDLIAPEDTEALTRALWHSINHQLLALPDDVVVLPTHGAGSFCSSGAGGVRWTTIGRERASNPLLQASDEDEFVRRVLAGFGSYPPYFHRLRGVNQAGPHVYGSLPALSSLTAEQVRELRDRGAVVVDVRSVRAYAAAHIRGSLANTLRPQFASWLGWIVEDPDTPLVFVVDQHTDHRELVRQCLNIGYERLAGTVTMSSWQAGGGSVATTALIGAEDLDGRQLVDVRQHQEFATGHVPGALHVELGALAQEADRLGSESLVTMCGHGERAATAASRLEAAGHTAPTVFDGGPEDWAAVTGEDLART